MSLINSTYCHSTPTPSTNVFCFGRTVYGTSIDRWRDLHAAIATYFEQIDTSESLHLWNDSSLFKENERIELSQFFQVLTSSDEKGLFFRQYPPSDKCNELGFKTLISLSKKIIDKITKKNFQSCFHNKRFQRIQKWYSWSLSFKGK